MKPVRKGGCPASLAAYAAAHPGATWRDMRRTDRHPVYDDIRDQLLLDQDGLCAYCECRLSRTNVQVEHFVPRSDASGGSAGQLDWDNLLAVCSGGATPEREDDAPPAPRRGGVPAPPGPSRVRPSLARVLHHPPFLPGTGGGGVFAIRPLHGLMPVLSAPHAAFAAATDCNEPAKARCGQPEPA